jgi:hypothetical protein
LMHRRTYRGSPKLPIKGRYAASIKGRYWARPGGILAGAWLGNALGREPDEGDHGLVTKFGTVPIRPFASALAALNNDQLQDGLGDFDAAALTSG